MSLWRTAEKSKVEIDLTQVEELGEPIDASFSRMGDELCILFRSAVVLINTNSLSIRAQMALPESLDHAIVGWDEQDRLWLQTGEKELEIVGDDLVRLLLAPGVLANVVMSPDGRWLVLSAGAVLLIGTGDLRGRELDVSWAQGWTRSRRILLGKRSQSWVSNCRTCS